MLTADQAAARRGAVRCGRRGWPAPRTTSSSSSSSDQRARALPVRTTSLLPRLLRNCNVHPTLTLSQAAARRLTLRYPHSCVASKVVRAPRARTRPARKRQQIGRLQLPRQPCTAKMSQATLTLAPSASPPRARGRGRARARRPGAHAARQRRLERLGLLQHVAHAGRRRAQRHVRRTPRPPALRTRRGTANQAPWVLRPLT